MAGGGFCSRLFYLCKFFENKISKILEETVDTEENQCYYETPPRKSAINIREAAAKHFDN